jgi:C-terminal processing protease CtpA/Prc
MGMLWMASTGAHRLPTNLSQSLLQRIQSQTGESQQSSQTNVYQRFDQVLDILSREYYTTGLIDSGAMRLSAIKAFVEGLGDPYTMYMDASETT